MKSSLKRMLAAVLASVLLLGTLTGCVRRTAVKPTFRVIASFYPIYIMTLNLTKNVPNVEVDNMAGQQTGCLHDYQLQSSDMQALSQAQLFIINGAGMEGFMTKVTHQLPKLTVLDSSTGITPLKGADGETNPHMWVGITNYIAQVRNAAAGLKKADPAHAVQYGENADVYLTKLAALRSRMHAALDNLPNRNIVTFHEAFPYFAQEFHLNIVVTVQREPDSQPSARELAETIRMIRKSGAKAVFAEPQYEKSAARIVAQESGAGVYTLDPAVTGTATADAYLNAMEQNMVTLQKALA